MAFGWTQTQFGRNQPRIKGDDLVAQASARTVTSEDGTTIVYLDTMSFNIDTHRICECINGTFRGMVATLARNAIGSRDARRHIDDCALGKRLCSIHIRIRTYDEASWNTEPRYGPLTKYGRANPTLVITPPTLMSMSFLQTRGSLPLPSLVSAFRRLLIPTSHIECTINRCVHRPECYATDVYTYLQSSPTHQDARTSQQSNQWLP